MVISKVISLQEFDQDPVWAIALADVPEGFISRNGKFWRHMTRQDVQGQDFLMFSGTLTSVRQVMSKYHVSIDDQNLFVTALLTKPLQDEQPEALAMREPIEFRWWQKAVNLMLSFVSLLMSVSAVALTTGCALPGIFDGGHGSTVPADTSSLKNDMVADGKYIKALPNLFMPTGPYGTLTKSVLLSHVPELGADNGKFIKKFFIESDDGNLIFKADPQKYRNWGKANIVTRYTLKVSELDDAAQKVIKEIKGLTYSVDKEKGPLLTVSAEFEKKALEELSKDQTLQQYVQELKGLRDKAIEGYKHLSYFNDIVRQIPYLVRMTKQFDGYDGYLVRYPNDGKIHTEGQAYGLWTLSTVYAEQGFAQNVFEGIVTASRNYFQQITPYLYGWISEDPTLAMDAALDQLKSMLRAHDLIDAGKWQKSALYGDYFSESTGMSKDLLDNAVLSGKDGRGFQWSIALPGIKKSDLPLGKVQQGTFYRYLNTEKTKVTMLYNPSYIDYEAFMRASKLDARWKDVMASHARIDKQIFEKFGYIPDWCVVTLDMNTGEVVISGDIQGDPQFKASGFSSEPNIEFVRYVLRMAAATMYENESGVTVPQLEGLRKQLVSMTALAIDTITYSRGKIRNELALSTGYLLAVLSGDKEKIAAAEKIIEKDVLAGVPVNGFFGSAEKSDRDLAFNQTLTLMNIYYANKIKEQKDVFVPFQKWSEDYAGDIAEAGEYPQFMAWDTVRVSELDPGAGLYRGNTTTNISASLWSKNHLVQYKDMLLPVDRLQGGRISAQVAADALDLKLQRNAQAQFDAIMKGIDSYLCVRFSDPNEGLFSNAVLMDKGAVLQREQDVSMAANIKIAYTLFAAQQMVDAGYWKDTGAISYGEYARKILSAVFRSDRTDGKQRALYAASDRYVLLKPSRGYWWETDAGIKLDASAFSMQYFEGLKKYDAERAPLWQKLKDTHYAIIEAVLAQNGNVIPDYFMVKISGDTIVVSNVPGMNFAQGDHALMLMQNIALDALWNKNDRAIALCKRMIEGKDPRKVKTSGFHDEKTVAAYMLLARAAGDAKAYEEFKTEFKKFMPTGEHGYFGLGNWDYAQYNAFNQYVCWRADAFDSGIYGAVGPDSVPNSIKNGIKEQMVLLEGQKDSLHGDLGRNWLWNVVMRRFQVTVGNFGFRTGTTLASFDYLENPVSVRMDLDIASQLNKLQVMDPNGKCDTRAIQEEYLTTAGRMLARGYGFAAVSLYAAILTNDSGARYDAFIYFGDKSRYISQSAAEGLYGALASQGYRTEEMATIFMDIYKSNPNNPFLALKTASLLFESGQTENALKIFREVVYQQQDPVALSEALTLFLGVFERWGFTENGVAFCDLLTKKNATLADLQALELAVPLKASGFYPIMKVFFDKKALVFENAEFEDRFPLIRDRLDARSYADIVDMKNVPEKAAKLLSYMDDMTGDEYQLPYSYYQVLDDVISLYYRVHDYEKVERLYTIMKDEGKVSFKLSDDEELFAKYVREAKHLLVDNHAEEAYKAKYRTALEAYFGILLLQGKDEQVVAEASKLFDKELDGKGDELHAMFAYRVGGNALFMAYNHMDKASAIKDVRRALLFGDSSYKVYPEEVSFNGTTAVDQKIFGTQNTMFMNSYYDTLFGPNSFSNRLIEARESAENHILPDVAKKIAAYHKYLTERKLFEKVPTLYTDAQQDYVHALSWGKVDIKTALKAYEELIRENPENSLLYAEKSTIYLYGGNIEQAQKYVDKAASIAPNSLIIKKTQLEVANFLKKSTESIMKQMLDIVRGNAFASDNDAVIVANTFASYYLKKGEHSKALAIVKKLCKNEPITLASDDPFWKDIEQILSKRYVAHNKNLLADTYAIYGDILKAQGDYVRAIDLYQSSQQYRYGLRDITVDLNIADSYLKLGDKTGAKKVLSGILLRKASGSFDHEYGKALDMYAGLFNNPVDIYESALSNSPYSDYNDVSREDKTLQTIKNSVARSPTIEAIVHRSYGAYLQDVVRDIRKAQREADRRMSALIRAQE